MGAITVPIKHEIEVGGKAAGVVFGDGLGYGQFEDVDGVDGSQFRRNAIQTGRDVGDESRVVPSDRLEVEDGHYLETSSFHCLFSRLRVTRSTV